MAAARMPQQARSQLRRDALLQAAVELVVEGGVQAVTHRAVAARAGLPPSTAGYFFDSIDDLAAEALRVSTERAVADYLELRRRALRGQPGDADRLIHAVAHRQAAPGENAAQVTLYLEASHNPKLRPPVSQALDAFRRHAVETLEAAGVSQAKTAGPAFVALFDGFMLHALAQPDAPPSPDVVIEAINALLAGFLLADDERREITARLQAPRTNRRMSGTRS